MKKSEWVQHCARRLRQLDRGLSWPYALQSAALIADRQADKYGASGIAWQAPEDAADYLTDQDDEMEV